MAYLIPSNEFVNGFMVLTSDNYLDHLALPIRRLRQNVRSSMARMVRDLSDASSRLTKLLPNTEGIGSEGE